ncbi:MAG TPA: hypothetical protein VJQ42_05725, partial [Rhodanobacteraceae bacterium]|nr:hypothetical protein [Rhodanobacteraceae bacterium]
RVTGSVCTTITPKIAITRNRSIVVLRAWADDAADVLACQGLMGRQRPSSNAGFAGDCGKSARFERSMFDILTVIIDGAA